MQMQLWVAYPADLADEQAAAECRALLDDEDQARWQSFRFERDQRGSLATRALVRLALSYQGTVDPAAWRFSKNAHGKPAIVPACGLHLNASNCAGLVVCLVAAEETGVDVEPADRGETILEVAPRVFSAQERAQLEGLSKDKRSDRALSLWTLKEAYIKARGLGLAIPLEKFSFLFTEEGQIHLKMEADLGDRPENWRFFLVDHAGHRIAGMVRSSTLSDLEVLEARPPAARPVKLENCAVRWFPS